MTWLWFGKNLRYLADVVVSRLYGDLLSIMHDIANNIMLAHSTDERHIFRPHLLRDSHASVFDEGLC